MLLTVLMTSSLALLKPEAEHVGVSPRVLESLVGAISWNPRVERAVIYGSRGRGQPKYWSDIDVAIYGDLTSIDYLILGAAVEAAPIVYPIDFVFYHSRYTTDALRRAIDRDGIVIYDRASDPSAPTAR